jgi:nitrate reductase gamma subunit
VTHDAHLPVSCEACHLKDVVPIKKQESGRVIWETEKGPGEISRLHHMEIRDREGSCERCHFKGNDLGAAAMVLPAKSILCMPCHTATLSRGDTTTILSLVVFLAGTVGFLSYVLTGSIYRKGRASLFSKFSGLMVSALKHLFSRDIIPILKALFFDVLLQRRLYKRSARRWLIHGLIFYAFLFRFGWGLFALIVSLGWPDWETVWVMLDKNHPVTALGFDLSGALLFAGVGLAFLRGLLGRKEEMTGIPGQDRLALALIAGIVLVGFFLEGMRIAMTGFPEGSAYAFLGYGLARLFASSSALPDIYGYIWYVHAVLTGAFIAYIPFSRMMHIILAPVVLAMNAAKEDRT